MGQYLVVIWNVDTLEVIYQRIIEAASAADAKAACAELADRRPNYEAGATKLTI